MTPLQARLDEFKKAFESGAPPYNAPREAIETMHRSTAELKASGLENRALKVGDLRSGVHLVQSRSRPGEFRGVASPRPPGR